MSSHINQEGLVVVSQPSDSKGHIQQEGLLVVASPSPARHVQQEGVIVVGFPFSSCHILQEGIIVIRENVVDSVAKKSSGFGLLG